MDRSFLAAASLITPPIDACKENRLLTSSSHTQQNRFSLTSPHFVVTLTQNRILLSHLKKKNPVASKEISVKGLECGDTTRFGTPCSMNALLMDSFAQFLEEKHNNHYEAVEAATFMSIKDFVSVLHQHHVSVLLMTSHPSPGWCCLTSLSAQINVMGPAAGQ